MPGAVSALHSACPDRDGRRMLAENLAEEEGVEAGKQDHASLWMMFACGLGESESAVREQALNLETQALIDAFRRLSRKSYASGLGALYAYESQFPGVAAAKIAGLVERYDINDEPTLRFFKVHETADVEHSNEEQKVSAEVYIEEIRRARAKDQSEVRRQRPGEVHKSEPCLLD